MRPTLSSISSSSAVSCGSAGPAKIYSLSISTITGARPRLAHGTYMHACLTCCFIHCYIAMPGLLCLCAFTSPCCLAVFPLLCLAAFPGVSHSSVSRFAAMHQLERGRVGQLAAKDVSAGATLFDFCKCWWRIDSPSTVFATAGIQTALLLHTEASYKILYTL